jgi:DEAD/DEAH box helicase domain-containing protein
MEQYSSPQCSVEITKVPVNGKEGYFLQIGSCCWEVELQVPFDGARGVAVPSKPDFVFWPKSKGNKQRPVVVFTDGFQFHKDKVAVDSNKRLAIRDACACTVWSLTWNDVQRQLTQNRSPVQNDAMDVGTMPWGKYAEQILKKRNLQKIDFEKMASFDLLMRILMQMTCLKAMPAQ